MFFFNCLSLFCGFTFTFYLRDFENDTQTKFRLYCEHIQIDSFSFQEVFLNNFIILEDLFQINTIMYEYVEHENETVCQLIQNSCKIYPKTIKLILFKKHFSYIFNFEKYCSVFHLPKIDVLCYHQNNCNQHLKHCDGKVKYRYKRGIFQLTLTVFEESAEFSICVFKNNRFIPISLFLILSVSCQKKIYPSILPFSSMKLFTFH